MPYYRKKPLIIEAELFEPASQPLPFRGCGDPCQTHGGGKWYIDTLEGRFWLTPGDMVIRGVSGEFYACKPNIFAASYEEMEPRHGA